MKTPSGFKLHAEGPESQFLSDGQCFRFHLPPANDWALELANALRLEPGDIKAEYSSRDGKRYVRIFKRIVGEIGCCYDGWQWLSKAKNCVEEEQPFDLVDVLSDNACAVNALAEECADRFRCSSGPSHQRRFRLLNDIPEGSSAPSLCSHSEDAV